ncbi:hypothetical protein TYRP_018540 [Tyrophagus putrescentiae]|nr:hypothetical protein TYRP_018540 [Tyrophagus putrescentiae]
MTAWECTKNDGQEINETLTKEVDNDDETAVEEQLIGGDGSEHPVDVRPVGGPLAECPVEAMLTVAPKAVTGLRDDALAAVLAECTLRVLRPLSGQVVRLWAQAALVADQVRIAVLVKGHLRLQLPVLVMIVVGSVIIGVTSLLNAWPWQTVPALLVAGAAGVDGHHRRIGRQL